MPLETPLPSLAHRLRAEFEQRLATALREAGVAAEECVERVRLVIRTAEADSLDIWAIYHLLGNAGRLRELVEAAVGRPVGKLAIAPVPGYFEPLIPLFEKQFDQIVLCDNFKVGKQMSDAPAVIDLPSLQAQLDDVDCILIGTVDQKIRGLFSAQLPAEKTISIYDILDDSVIVSENSIRNARELEGVIREFDNPFIILCHRFTPPYVSTVSALRDAGYDVVILSRFKENAGLGIKQTDLHLLGAKAVYPVNLIENLYLAQVLDHCPWWFLNDGFLHASWSFERATWHYAYTAAMLEMINAPRILCLYDPIKPAIKDWEYEQPALAAWAAAIRRADGVHVGCANQHLVDFMIRQSGGRCPFIGFLRYNLPAHKRRPPRTESFSLALVSPIADEVSDPGTDLRAVIRELLRQGLDLHYYTGSPASWVFRDSLPEEEARHLHVHRQIIDQQELIWEISRYHAGWCVGNFDVFDDIVVKMESREGRDFYSLFPRTTVPSRALAFGSAGLPIIYSNILHEVAGLFPAGCAIPFNVSQARFLGDILRRQDWPKLWRQMDDAVPGFAMRAHFPRFQDFIGQAKAHWAERRADSAVAVSDAGGGTAALSMRSVE